MLTIRQSVVNKAETFLKNNKIHTSTINLQNIVDAFLDEMKMGLKGKESSLEMIPTYIEAENEFKDGDRVLAMQVERTLDLQSSHFEETTRLRSERFSIKRCPV